MIDMEIVGKIIGYDTVTGRTNIPGYAHPTVGYIDPYSGEPDSYVVNQDINRKKNRSAVSINCCTQGREKGI